MTAVKRVDLFENLYVKDSTSFNVSSLASLLGVQQKELIQTFHVSPATANRSGIDPNNEVMKLWLRIFNLAADLIESSEPTLTREQIQLKMSRWLRLPNSHFGGQSLLDVMMSGKARKVVKFIEQLQS